MSSPSLEPPSSRQLAARAPWPIGPARPSPSLRRARRRARRFALRRAGELYSSALVVFAAQGYANDLVLPPSQLCGFALPQSRRDLAREAFERVMKSVLPATHLELQRALEREARS